MSTSVQTTILPRADIVPTVGGELKQPDAFDLPQPFGRTVGGAIVDHDDLVAVVGLVQRLADTVEFGLEVSLLIEDRQDHRHIGHEADHRSGRILGVGT
jgi:hypothetical protein